MGKVIIVLMVFIGMCSEFVLSVNPGCQLKTTPVMEKKWTKFQKKVVDAIKLDITLSGDCDDPIECIRPLSSTDEKVITDNRTGCRCSRNATEKSVRFECRCCFRLKKWNYLICIAGGFDLSDTEKKFALFATVDGTLVERITFPLDSLPTVKFALCIPLVLPPPLSFLSPCFKAKIRRPSSQNNQSWEICGKLKLGIFLYPVFNIYTSCFQISKSLDSMKLEGQTDITEDVIDPALVEIRDLDNYNALVCLCNQKKNDTIRCKSGRQASDKCPVPVKPVEIKDKINWVETPVFKTTPFLVLLYHEKRPIPVRDIAKDVQFEFIKEALQEAEANQWLKNDGPLTYDSPGSSCGGALLTADKVLTICACVRTFYTLNKLKTVPEEEQTYLFDIRANEISLRFADPKLSSTKYTLDSDGSKMMADSFCSKEIQNKETKVAQTSMIVMPFTPKIANPADIFVHWPPLKAVPQFEQVNLVAYKLEPLNVAWFWKTASGKKIDFYDTAVNFFLKKCEITTYAKEELEKDKPLPPDAVGRISGFRAGDVKFQLCDGEIGFPLTVGRQLIGLSSLPIDCTDGSIAGSVFTDEIIKDIEKLIGNNSLHVGRANFVRHECHWYIVAIFLQYF